MSSITVSNWAKSLHCLQWPNLRAPLSAKCFHPAAISQGSRLRSFAIRRAGVDEQKAARPMGISTEEKAVVMGMPG
jgi:hypothetical protein